MIRHLKLMLSLKALAAEEVFENLRAVVLKSQKQELNNFACK